MLQSTIFLRLISRSATFLPFALAAAACSGSDAGSAGTTSDAGSGGNGASSGGQANGNGGSNPNGGSSANGGSNTNGGSNGNGGSAGTGGTVVTAPVGPAPVLLGSANNYAILAKSAISNVPTSVITGDLGLSPAAATYVTGFALTRAGTKWTSTQVTGGVFAANNDPPTPSNLTTAVGNMQTAYTDAAGRPTPDFLNLGGGAIGGLTLTPGLYKWTSTVTIPSDVTIAGAPDDTWIFQITGNLTMSSAKNMTLSGGARAKNIVWQVAGFVDLGTSSHSEGIMLSKTAIKLGTGASVNGRLLAQMAVNIAGATVTAPAP